MLLERGKSCLSNDLVVLRTGVLGHPDMTTRLECVDIFLNLEHPILVEVKTLIRKFCSIIIAITVNNEQTLTVFVTIGKGEQILLKAKEFALQTQDVCLALVTYGQVLDAFDEVVAGKPQTLSVFLHALALC